MILKAVQDCEAMDGKVLLLIANNNLQSPKMTQGETDKAKLRLVFIIEIALQ